MCLLSRFISPRSTEIEDPLEQNPSASQSFGSQTEQEAATLDAAPDPLEPKDKATTTADVLGGHAQQSDVGALGGKGSGWVADEEQEARKVSDTQIKKYWRQKEQERMAPRVHQEDLGVYEKVLREWDMSYKFGVSPVSQVDMSPRC